MTISPRRIGAIAIGLAVAAFAANAGLANSSASTTVCGIATGSERGMLALEGTILSPVALSGEYRLAIRSSGGGSSNISQGGYFTAKANEATTLGKVLINAGSSYSIDFDVTAGGQKIDCDQDIASLR